MKNRILNWFTLLILTTVIVYFLWPYFLEVKYPGAEFPSIGSQSVRAEVTVIAEEGTIDLGDRVQNYQILGVKLLEGEHAGLVAEIDFGVRQIRSDDYRLVPGDLVLVTVSETPDGKVNVYSVRPDGSDLKPLTDSGCGGCGAPSWTPDGAHILFWGPTTFWLMDPDGANQRPINASKLTYFGDKLGYGYYGYLQPVS